MARRRVTSERLSRLILDSVGDGQHRVSRDGQRHLTNKRPHGRDERVAHASGLPVGRFLQEPNALEDGVVVDLATSLLQQLVEYSRYRPRTDEAFGKRGQRAV